MRLGTRVVVATTLLCSFSAPRIAFGQFTELTSRLVVASAQVDSSAEFPRSTGTRINASRLDSLDASSGLQLRYGLQADLTDTLGAELGIQALRVPVRWRPATQATSADHLNIPMVTLGVNAHGAIGRLELSGGPMIAVSARNTLTFSSAGTVTTMTVSDAWTWGLQGSASVAPFASDDWSVGLFVGYTDLRLRVTGATTTQLAVTPISVGVMLSYRH